jgi:hypothetical protein
MKATAPDSFARSVRTVREFIASGRKVAAVRWLRTQGLTFPTARTMVVEIAANAPWYRHY